MNLYHYTCEHSHAAIGERGLIRPLVEIVPEAKAVPWPGQFAWFTDLATPLREALGLTSHILTCDRTLHRYRVTDATNVMPWWEAARAWPRSLRDELEGAPGARPIHWWVSQDPVPVVYDPIRAEASA